MAGDALTSRRHDVDGLDDAVELFFERGWTDGLPIVPPTEEKVAAFVGASGRDPDQIVGEYPSRRRVITVEKAAINAVMAGCKPEYFPVVLALLEALCDERSSMHVPNATTGGAALGFIVNGPVIERLGMNFRGNVLGPGNRANSTIGRALRLVQINVLGSVPGAGNEEEHRPILDRATIGQPARYAGYHIVENEVDYPSLNPLHVDRGYDRDHSVVTLFSTNGHVQYGLSAAQDADETIAMLCQYLRGSGKMSAAGFTVVILPPECADHFVRAGWSKADIRLAIFESTRRTVRWAKENGWGVSGGLGERIGSPVVEGDDERYVAAGATPDDIYVAVSGAYAGAFVHCLFPYGGAPVSRVIEGY